jgi:hypothetical protein
MDFLAWKQAGSASKNYFFNIQTYSNTDFVLSSSESNV